MGLGKEVTSEQIASIIACKKLGATQQKIAEVVSCSQTTIPGFWHQKKIKKKKQLGHSQIMTFPKQKRLAAAVLKDKVMHHQNLAQVTRFFQGRTEAK